MKKFNSTDLFTGYIKQLLASFNLPKLRIYTAEHQAYHDYAVKYNKSVSDDDKISEERYDILETTTKDDIDPTSMASDKIQKYPVHLRYIPYIKNDKFQEYINGQWIEVGKRNTAVGPHLHFYDYGNKYLNYTKTLRIKDNIYDSYTHEYLGDYLRFLRDYNNVNLMQLYNCFSNRACTRLDISGNYVSKPAEYFITSVDLSFFTTTINYVGFYIERATTTGSEFILVTNDNKDNLNIVTATEATETKKQTMPYERTEAMLSTFRFNTKDVDYKIYMLPVKLFKEYTIAIDSNSTVELCCGIYGDYQDTRDKFKELPSLTYQKYANSLFSHPILYQEVLNLNQATLKDSAVELAQNECDLKLFIKVPKNNDSTIVVLEGNYLNWNDELFSKLKQQQYNITSYGEGEPTSTPAEGDIYLDTAGYQLYIYDIEATTATWKHYGFIWPEHIEEYCSDIDVKLVNTLLIDNNIYNSGELKRFDLATHKYYKYEMITANTEYSLTNIYGELATLGNTNNWAKEKTVFKQLSENEFNALKTKTVTDKTAYGCVRTEASSIEYEKLGQWFEQYVSLNKKKANKYTAYFNTKINMLFVGYNNSTNPAWQKQTNNSIINIDGLTNDKDINLISPLQLLRFNTKDQHPFADRLMEYLLDNAITNLPDEISDNIRRAQKVLELNYGSNTYIKEFNGAWDWRMNKIIYDYLNKHYNTYQINHDVLGYVDKDAEKLYAFTKIDPDTKTKKSVSILNVELNKEGE